MQKFPEKPIKKTKKKQKWTFSSLFSKYLGGVAKRPLLPNDGPAMPPLPRIFFVNYSDLPVAPSPRESFYKDHNSEAF